MRTRYFPHQPGQKIAGEPGLHGLVQCCCLFVLHREMGRSPHPVQLVKVVGQHAGLEQFFGKADLDSDGIVHAMQEHGLVQEDDALAAQGPQCPDQFRADLSRMVDVQHQTHGQSAVAQYSGKPLVQPLGQHHGQAAMDAQAFQMGNLLQLFDQGSESCIAQAQGIAATENHLADVRMLLQLLQQRLPVAGSSLVIRIGKVAAKTVAAVDGTGARGDEQCASMVLVQQPVALVGSLVGKRVCAETRGILQFGAQGQDLAQQGIVHVPLFHQRGEEAGDAETEGAARSLHGRLQLIAKFQVAQQVFHPIESIGQLPLPAFGFQGCGGKRYHRHFFSRGRGVPAAPVVQDEENMATYSTNEFRGGLKLLLDGDPCVIIENEFVKPGKGQAFNRVKLRNLKTGRVLEKTFKSGESVEAADVMDRDLQYLYNDGEYWYFMDNESFEQYQADAQAMGDAVKWIKDQDVCNVTLWNNQPILVEAPNFVVLEITDTDPGLKGDTSGGGGKPATLETGAVVRVPLFVQIGEKIKVDTRKGEYISRAKD